MNQNVILVNVMQSIVSAMYVPGVTPMNYEPGRSIQIIASIGENDNSITLKGEKYPLFAMLLPIRIKRGVDYAAYGVVKIPRIVIATPSKSWDGTQHVLDAFDTTAGSFNNILYPCYYEFLRCCSISPYILEGDPDAINHDVMENPGIQETSSTSSDFIDSLEIYNLELTLNQIKTC